MTQNGRQDTLVEEQRSLRQQISNVKKEIQQKKKNLKETTKCLNSCHAYQELQEVEQNIKDVDKKRGSIQESLRQSQGAREQRRLTAVEGEVLRDKLTLLNSQEKEHQEEVRRLEQEVSRLKHTLPFHSISALQGKLNDVTQQIETTEHDHIKEKLQRQRNQLKKMHNDVQNLEKTVKQLETRKKKLQDIVSEKKTALAEKASVRDQSSTSSSSSTSHDRPQHPGGLRRLNNQRHQLQDRQKELEQTVRDQFPEEEERRQRLLREVEELQQRQRRLSRDLAQVNASLSEEQVVFAEDEYPMVVGKGGRRLEKLRRGYGVEVTADRVLGMVTFRGSASAVRDAARALREDMADERILEETISLPDALVGALLAGGGKTVRDMREQSQARIHVDGTDGRVTLRGGAARVRRAGALLQEWMDANRMLEERVDAGPALVRLLLQDKGRRIKEIKERTGVSRLSVEEGRGEVVMAGPRDTARLARQEVEGIRRGMSYRELRFGEELRGLILGKGGSNIRRIEKETGAVLAMERNPHHNNRKKKKRNKTKTLQRSVSEGTLHIGGDEEGVAAAFTELDELLRANRRNTSQVTFEPRFVEVLLADRGAVLRRIQRECHVGVDIDRLRGVAAISGKASGTRRAAEQVREAVDEARRRESQMETVRIPLDGRPLGAVIGRRGKQIRQIRRESQATVTVDSDERDDGETETGRKRREIKIRGLPEQVTRARSMVEDVLGRRDDDNDGDDNDYKDHDEQWNKNNDTDYHEGKEGENDNLDSDGNDVKNTTHSYDLE